MEFRNRFLTIALVLSFGCLLLPGRVALAREKTPKDTAEAIQWAQEALVKSGYRVNKVDSQFVLFGDAKGNYGIALARVISTSSEYSGGYTWRVFWTDYAHDHQEALVVVPRQMEKLKAALDFLAANAREEVVALHAQEFSQFQAKAKAWREAAVKPAMPEEAHEHQVLAEFAFKEKDVDKAVSEYSAALSIFPTWPEGQYNLAMLAGEKKYYAVATLHMKEYLELTPDSPDAQAARDSMIIWRDKLKTVLADSANGAAPRLKNVSRSK